MADPLTTLEGFFSSLGENPVNLLLLVGGVSLLLLLILLHHIHKIRSQEIYVHQAWGAKWKGR